MLNLDELNEFNQYSEARRAETPEAHYRTAFDRFHHGHAGLIQDVPAGTHPDLVEMARVWATATMETFAETQNRVPEWCHPTRRVAMMRALDDLQKRIRRVMPPYSEDVNSLLEWLQEQKQKPDCKLATLLPLLETQLNIIRNNPTAPAGVKTVYRQFFRDFTLYLMMILGYMQHLNDPSHSLNRIDQQPFVANYRRGDFYPFLYFVVKNIANIMTNPVLLLAATMVWRTFISPTTSFKNFIIAILVVQFTRHYGLQALEQHVQETTQHSLNDNPPVEQDLPWAGMGL